MKKLARRGLPNNAPIRILQIGDIHFPSAITERPAADLKRDPFDISDEIAPEGTRLQKITQSFTQYSAGAFDAIAFMGDFTTGNRDSSVQMNAMDRCFEYVDTNIVRPLLGKNSRSKCLFVPGNHDVDRTKCPSNAKDRLEKFGHYITSLSTHGQKKICAKEIGSIEIKQSSGVAYLHGINTCIGCGEFLTFPQDIKDELVRRLASVIKGGSDAEAKNLVDKYLDLTERLDAPLIDGSVLHQLDSTLNRLMQTNEHSVQIVVGHHNLLPQTIPRVAPFSELMNSGELRTFLATKVAPIIYLHGHIHQDPIEIVFSQASPQSCVISISAPEFVEGYNILELHFDDGGAPLGLVIKTIRQDNVGRLVRTEPRRIPFRQGSHRIAAITSVAREIFYNTFSKNAQLHFNEIKKEYPAQGEETIERALVELEWLGLVQIANRSRSPQQWNVSSAV